MPRFQIILFVDVLIIVHSTVILGSNFILQLHVSIL